MDVINADFKKGVAKIKINDLDDIWYLSHLIDIGDFVKGKTTRKIKIGEGENAKTVKKTLTLKIEAETVDLTESTLRVNGKIKEGPEDIPKDSYHSISLEEGSEFFLEKVRWLEYHKQKLKEACEKKYNYLLCLFDREEALFALTKKFGYDILAKITGEVQKKAKKVEIKKDFQIELIKALETYDGRYNPESIILASPAFYKEDLFKKIASAELKKKIVLASCSDISERSLDEVLRHPELSNQLKDSRARVELLLIEELLNEINKKDKASYGWKEVKESIDSGAVSKLLITDNFIQQKRNAKQFAEVDECMKSVDALKGEIHVISSKNDSGKKLNGLGGIAAILRYKTYT
ncbi:MAG: mRNA surveillance protein pelota [Nanoarchaeota archaeon]|nr:mRNA surveillance protein pelota [Nanoarchaeota archaeon]MBU1631916.1 mRNA surveillance protein pelota [Nanoarchaeota archaeon]MBU1875567.1 mRNA surveillance protein pelota [Nanoarchaeota archaeon]